MFGIGKTKLSTESYKGVRDFYPEDQQVQNYIFGIMREVVESWGYVEYGASVLESLELYRAKTSEEIVNEQIYSFTDRGGREVALRPEMTPTVARLIAGRLQELPAPIRWYSIPNLFRYEKPQRGRLREHWQLNVDIFGVEGIWAEIEIMALAHSLMCRFGATQKDFVVKVNSRKILNDLFAKIQVAAENRQFVSRLIDKKAKMPEAEFRTALATLVGEDKAKALSEMLYFGEGLLTMLTESEGASQLNQLLETLRGRGIKNIVFDPTVTRGFDYYTGIVFEVFDTDSQNSRSLFGGGRYDNLVGNFTSQSVPAVGFGMGDLTARDFLMTHGLLPELSSTTDLYICVAPDTQLETVYALADELRKAGVRTAIDISGRKLGDQLKSLDRRQIPFVMTVGSEELKNQKFMIRQTQTREEKSGDLSEIIGTIRMHQ